MATAGVIARLARTAPPPGRVSSSLALTLRLAVTSFKLRYSSSALGYAWSLLRPLLLFGMLYLVFALFLLRGRTAAGENFPVELLVGIVAWTFFAEATTSATVAVAANADMLHKAQFPRWVLVAAAVLSATFTLVVNLLLVLAVGLIFHWYAIGWQSLWVPALLLELIALAFGLGLLLSTLFVYYRDLSYIWEIVLQLLFYVSAIIFPLSLVPAAFQWAVNLNPVAQIIEDLRRALVSDAIPWSATLLGTKVWVPITGVALSLALGAVLFRRLSARFGERL